MSRIATPAARRIAMTLFTGILVGAPEAAHAWSKHRLLMPYVVDSLGEYERKRLGEPAAAPCSADDRAIYEGLAQELGLQPSITLPPSSQAGAAAGEKCVELSGSRAPTDIPLALLRIGDWADDPDRGMDQNLPDSLDPTGERRYMGGKTGGTSQGFRHMYFGGWKLSAPIASFQIPTRAVGQSPDRVELLSLQAKRMWSSRQIIWGARTIGWATHFLQDLAQPFHSVQIPNLRMVPWSSLLKNGFSGLVSEATRTIANYHFAYEQWTASQMLGADNPFDACLREPPKWTTVKWDPATGSPRELAHEVARRSLALGRAMGSAQIAFFGKGLKEPGVDLPNEKGVPDYTALDRDPARAEARKALVEVTCRALANAVESSRLLLVWWLKTT